MNDMSKVIAPKSDQLNSDDLIAGPRTITIRDVSISPGTEQPVSIYFEGDDNKPWKPCKSMSRVLVQAWGPDAKVYVGRSVTLYRDPKVKWGGMEVGGIRVSHVSHIERDMVMALTATKGKKAVATIKPLQPQQRQQQGQNQQQAGEDGAAKWASSYITKVESCQTMEELVAFENEKAARLAELKEKRPELHEKVVTAAKAQSVALAPKSDADSQGGFGNEEEPF